MSRGFVYATDATLALFLMLIVAATVVFLSAQAEENPYAKLHMARVGMDVLALLDRQGALAGGNATLIAGRLNETLPHNIGAHIDVYTYYKDVSGFNLISITPYGEDVPGNTTIYGVRRDFVSMKNGRIANYSVARMMVWQK